MFKLQRNHETKNDGWHWSHLRRKWLGVETMKVTCPRCNHRARIRSDVEQMPWCGDCCVQMESVITQAIKDVEKEFENLARTNQLQQSGRK